MRRNLRKKLLNSESAPLKTAMYRVLSETKHFEVSGPNLHKKSIFGTELKKKKKLLNSELLPLNTPTYQFLFKTKVLEPFLPKEGILGREFRKTNVNSESALLKTLIYWVLFKTKHFDFSGPILPIVEFKINTLE